MLLGASAPEESEKHAVFDNFGESRWPSASAR